MKFITPLCFFIVSHSLLSQNLVSLKVDAVQIIFTDSSEVISSEPQLFFLPKKDTVLSVFENDSLNVKINLRKTQQKGRPSAIPVLGFTVLPNQIEYEANEDNFVFATNMLGYNTVFDNHSECSVIAKESCAKTESNVLSIKINYVFIMGVPKDVDEYSFPYMQGKWLFHGENGELYKSCQYENCSKNGSECLFEKGFKWLEKKYVKGQISTETNYRKNGSKVVKHFENAEFVKLVIFDKKGNLKRVIEY